MPSLSAMLSPLHDIGHAIAMVFRALFVVGLCAVINAMTSPGYWWFKWVALGMGIAVVVALAKAVRALVLLALLAWAGRWLYRRYGAAAKAQFDDWAQRSQPAPSQVLLALRDHSSAAAGQAGRTV
jgi:hypothetical protein